MIPKAWPNAALAGPFAGSGSIVYGLREPSMSHLNW
jgi:hypothetical protein